eukprot:gene42287-52429_t
MYANSSRYGSLHLETAPQKGHVVAVVASYRYPDADFWSYDYAFFTKENDKWLWKSTTAYTYAPAEAINAPLKQLRPAEVDSLLAADDFPFGELPYFGSREAFEYLLGQSSLILAPDSTMMQHFTDNRAAFNELKALVLKTTWEHPEHRWKTQDEESPLGPQLHKLFLSSVDWEGVGAENPECLWFTIAGERLHNAMGYLYIENDRYFPGALPG